MRFIILLLSFLSISVFANPLFESELLKELSEQDRKDLITLASTIYNKPIVKIITMRTEAPVGNLCAVVSYASIPIDDRTHEFTSLILFNVNWIERPHRLSDEDKAVRYGVWMTSGVPDKYTLNRFPTSQGDAFVDLGPDMEYEAAAELMRHIDRNNYLIEFNSGSKAWDKELHKLSRKDVEDELKPQKISRIRLEPATGRIIVYAGEYGTIQWTFVWRDEKLIMISYIESYI